MSLYSYVDAPNSNLLCCICRAPFTDPVTTIACQHTFCRECITRALLHSPQCPVDRSPLDSVDLGPVNPIVRSLVDELLVECVYREEGCQHTVQRQLLPAHLKNECAFSDFGKRRIVRLKEKAQEPEEKVSALRTDAPPNLNPLENRSTSPPKQLFEAASASDGDEVSTSQSSNPTRRVSHLTEQNIILQNRVNSLEGAMQFLKKEMAMVRIVLNPWMQHATSNGWPSAVAATPGPSRNPFGGVLAPGVNDLPEQLHPIANIDGTQPAREGERDGARQDDSVPDHNDLSSYFPADDEVRVRRIVTASGDYGQTQRQRPPGFGHLHRHSVPSTAGISPVEPPPPLGMGYLAPTMGLYGTMLMPPSGRQYQPAATNVPDLDMSSPSLSDTLHGLHSDMVSLASTLDDTHRKSELALALMGGGNGAAIPGGGVVGEVLRLGEEVMGVRATVQGLRMQMHNLMMGNVGAMSLGFTGRPQPHNINPTGDEGNTEGFGLPLNQRPFYPGITKL